MIQKQFVVKAVIVFATLNIAGGFRAYAQDNDFARESNGCGGQLSYSALKAALVAAASVDKSGLNNQLWATILDHDGVVCAIAFSGVSRLAQPTAARIFSAQKANTANGFSTD